MTTQVRLLWTRGALAATAAGFVGKARRAKGSTDLLDHADVIASFTTLVLLLVRRRRVSAQHRVVDVTSADARLS